jgi:hypothetical protein
LDDSGRFKVVEVLKGEAEVAAKLSIAGGGHHFESIQRALSGAKPPVVTKGADAFEVVAFLEEQSANEWRPTLDSAGLVALKGDAVYNFQRDWFGGFSEDRHYTAKSFVAGVRAAILLAQERQRLLAAPRSPKRVRALVGLAVQRGRTTPLVPDFPATIRYHLGEIAQGLMSANAEERSALLGALQHATAACDQAVLLELAGLVRWNGAFDATAKFLDRGYAPAVRRAAMQALGQIDRYRAVDHLVPLLTLDEPELRIALLSLGPVWYPPQDRILNIKAVDPLAKLARDLRTRHHEQGPQVLLNESYALAAQLERYFHPRLAGILYEWALANDHASSEQALSDLKSAAGLKLNRGDADAWREWWKNAQPLLEKEYELRTDEGRDVWMKAWQAADEATREILMRLWFFEPEIDESAILAVAKQSDVARLVLAELWQRKRLSPETRKAIVEHFLRFKLIEENVHTPMYRTWRSYGFVAETDFPFPADSWVSARSDLSQTEREPKIDESDSGGSGSLQTAALGAFRSMGAQSNPGNPLLRGVIELREVDHQNGGKVLWTLRWTPEPLRLQHLPE